MKLKKIKSSLYIIGAIILVIAIILICVSAFLPKEELKIPGYVLIVMSSLMFLFAFGIDFRQTMILSKTEGDQFTFMSKNSIINELKKRDMDFEEGRTKGYYIELIREYEEIAFLIQLKKDEDEK